VSKDYKFKDIKDKKNPYDKSVEQVFYELNNYFMAKFGVANAVTKIGLDPRAFDQTVTEVYTQDKFRIGFSDIGNGLRIAGIRVVPRRHDDF
jgi:hypothetical protein